MTTDADLDALVARLRSSAFDKDNFPRMKSERVLSVQTALLSADAIVSLRQERDEWRVLEKASTKAFQLTAVERDNWCALAATADADLRKAREEVDALRHDIARHVQIASEQAEELEDLRQDLAAAQARVAELETELRRALAIAPSNAIAWQDRAIGAELERDQYRHELDACLDAMAQMNAPAIALAALQPPPPIIMPMRDWELHQQIQTLNERLAYVEPIVTAARNLVDNAEEYECDGLGLFAQHGWWEPLHDALDPDGSEQADDIRQPVAPAK